MTGSGIYRIPISAERCIWVALAALVIVLCAFRLVLAPGIEFYIGPVVYLTILRLFGLRAGLAAAALVMAPSIIWWGHPYAIFSALAHVLVVKRVGRNLNNVDATALFSVCIAAPFGWLVLEGLYHSPNPIIAFQLLRLLVNGLCCAALVDLLVTRLTFERLTGRFVRADRLEIGVYLRCLAHIAIAIIFILSSLLASRNLVTRLALERALVREQVASYVAGHPELAKMSLAPYATAPEGKRPALEFALSSKADDLATGSPRAKALGCSVVGKHKKSTNVRIEAVVGECEILRVKVADAPTYALISYRRSSVDAYAWNLVAVSAFLGVALALSLLMLGFQRAVERTVSRWRTIVNEMGATHLAGIPASGFLEFAEPTNLFVATNNRLVAILEEGRQATAALHMVQADLGLKLLENITFRPGEGYVEFDEIFSNATTRVSLTIRCPTPADLITSTDGNNHISLELQIIGADDDVWSQLVLRNLQPDGKYSSGFIYRKVEPTALINRLAHENRMALIGMQSSVTAHEIRQPLFTIGLIAERLMLTLQNMVRPTIAELAKDIEVINKSANTVLKIVSMTSSFARPEIDGDEACDPVAVINDCVEFWSRTFVRDGINLVFEQSWPEGARLRISETKLMQIMINTTKNAYESIRERQTNMPLPPGLITVTLTFTKDAYASIVCSDNGTGITRDAAEAVFTPFYSTKGRAQGSGLGLFITRAILRRAGGAISVQSRDGPGAAFEIKLPVAQAVKT